MAQSCISNSLIKYGWSQMALVVDYVVGRFMPHILIFMLCYATKSGPNWLYFICFASGIAVTAPFCAMYWCCKKSPLLPQFLINVSCAAVLLQRYWRDLMCREPVAWLIRWRNMVTLLEPFLNITENRFRRINVNVLGSVRLSMILLGGVKTWKKWMSAMYFPFSLCRYVLLITVSERTVSSNKKSRCQLGWPCLFARL